jgi:hypothetical protein
MVIAWPTDRDVFPDDPGERDCGKPATRRCCGQPVCSNCEHNSGTRKPHRIEPATEEPDPKRGEALPWEGHYADTPLGAWQAWAFDLILDCALLEGAPVTDDSVLRDRIGAAVRAPAGVPVERVELPEWRVAKVRGAMAFAREAWKHNDGAEGESVRLICNALETLLPKAKPDAGGGG